MSATDLLNQAASALGNNDAQSCLDLCVRVLALHPGNGQALHLRGVAHLQLGNIDCAIDDLRAVVDDHPGNAHAALYLGRALRIADRPDDAIPVLESAARDPRAEIDARYELARCLTRSRRSRDAMQEYQRILAKAPGHAHARANLAFLLERDNQLEQARQQAEQALSEDPGLSLAQLCLASVQRRSGESDQAANRLRTLLNREANPVNRSLAFNQLAQCLEATGEYDQAFSAWSSSNQLLRDNHPAAVAENDGSYGMETLAVLHDWLADNPAAAWSKPPDPGESPVFLVGFPRSGTTLLDRALSAHPEIEVLEEIELFETLRRERIEGGQLEQLGSLGAGELAAARNEYLDRRAQHRLHRDRPVVIDKLPLNLAYLFLVHRLFPSARIIFLLRDPRDVVLSCFFQSFDLQGAMPYFLDLESAARYYDRLMRFVSLQKQQLDLNLHELRYEDLVTSFEDEVRGVLRFLGLDWHPDVLDYRKRAAERSIDTPSYHQVAKPLYRGSIGRWQNYRQPLEPVLPLLEPWVTQFGYSRSGRSC